MTHSIRTFARKSAGVYTHTHTLFQPESLTWGGWRPHNERTNQRTTIDFFLVMKV